MDQWDAIVVGAGIAGVSAVRTLAERGGGRILLLNGESDPPYKRTKASKNIAGGFDPGMYELETEEWYRENGVTLRNGTAVQSLNTETHRITVGESEEEYGKLILCPGAEPLFPKTVRPHEASSFYVVRTAGDVKRLSSAARGAKRVLIDGMGVLAVEVAAELTHMGIQVTLAGATPQLMPRQLSIRGGEILEELLTAKGIRLRFQEEILSFEPRKKGGFSVAMIRDTGNFDMVVFCIGVAPRTELAKGAGIATNLGILVDRNMRTNAPDVFAAGDAAEHEGGLITHLWHAAEYQGEIAALNLLGEDEPFENIPFRLKCQVFDSYFFSAGKPRHPQDYGLEEMEINGSYQCFYFDDDALVGSVMVNDSDRAKLYETAVRERWRRDRVRSELAL